MSLTTTGPKRAKSTVAFTTLISPHHVEFSESRVIDANGVKIQFIGVKFTSPKSANLGEQTLSRRLGEGEIDGRTFNVKELAIDQIKSILVNCVEDEKGEKSFYFSPKGQSQDFAKQNLDAQERARNFDWQSIDLS